MKKLLILSMLIASGCAVKAIDVQTITIPPNTKPVVVTVKGTGTSYDYFLVHKAEVLLEIESSNGEKPTRVGGTPALK